MKTLIKKLEWISDYYLVYFLYNPNKTGRYHEHMNHKWGNKYVHIFQLSHELVGLKAQIKENFKN